MAFNELNSLEHYIIHQLSGINLNSNEVQEPKVGNGAQWHFEPTRGVTKILIQFLNFAGKCGPKTTFSFIQGQHLSVYIINIII